MAQITLDSSALDELNSVETRTLFDTADKLSSLGVGRIVNLPQIIVVGDQSSGKSSVLEAISHVHFPVQGGLCTRFATELVLRPGNVRCVTAVVQFADSTRPGQSLQVTDFNQEDIDRIISTAKVEMGLTESGRSFSKDVLRLEIQGPDMYPLTLVDLPGIFHTATATQSVEGMATVMELVEDYMKRPNSIILAIISANNQLANQVVLQEAAKHDPPKTRTLGVITKPDLLHPGSSSEHEYLQIVRGRDTVHNLGLGWHVLRNLADYEEHLGPRDTAEEQFFRSQAWGSIPSANRGVGSLRAKLSRILHDHIRQSLPAVIQDIQDKLLDLQIELDRLGQPRNTPEDMRAYLIDIASHFQRLAQDGIRGHYIDPFFGGFSGTHRKLRSNLRNFNKAIRHILVSYGSAQQVIDGSRGSSSTSQHLLAPVYLDEFVQVYTTKRSLPAPELITWAELSIQLERQAASNQGTELPGYLNMEIVIQLFQKQAKPWKRIAALHNEEIIKLARIFVNEAFEYVVGSSNSNSTTDAILNTIVLGFFVEKEEQLSTKLEELFRPFDKGFARPLDADFQEAMEKAATERATELTESGSNVSEEQLGAAISPQSNSDFGTESMIYAMQTFYDMALRTFTDNLINLGIESCLIQDLPNLFTPRLVNDMDNEELDKLAAESEEVRNYRAQLRGDIELLKQGLEQCRRYRPRETARVPSSAQPAPPTTRQNLSANGGPNNAGASRSSGQSRSDSAASSSGVAVSTPATNRTNRNAVPSISSTTHPRFTTQPPRSVGDSARTVSPQPPRSQIVPATKGPSAGAQNTPPVASNTLSGSGPSGITGISQFLNSFSDLAIGPNTQTAFGASSPSSAGQPSGLFGATSSPAPLENPFAHLSTTSPLSGGTSAASNSSSSMNRSLRTFGEISAGQTSATPSAGKGKNVSVKSIFDSQAPPSSSTSGSSNTENFFGGASTRLV